MKLGGRIEKIRTIIKILHTREWIDANEKPHIKTYALLDDGTEAAGYGRFEVGDSCEVFFEEKWNEVKMRKRT